MKSRNVLLGWWFGDTLILAICASVLVVAALMSPSPDVLSLFGYEVPVMCNFRRTFGIPCMGCGLTRSFTFLAHGQVVDGFLMNPLGPIFFVFTATQVPYRALRLFRAWRGLPGARARV